MYRICPSGSSLAALTRSRDIFSMGGNRTSSSFGSMTVGIHLEYAAYFIIAMRASWSAIAVSMSARPVPTSRQTRASSRLNWAICLRSAGLAVLSHSVKVKVSSSTRSASRVIMLMVKAFLLLATSRFRQRNCDGLRFFCDWITAARLQLAALVLAHHLRHFALCLLALGHGLAAHAVLVTARGTHRHGI